MALAVGFGLVLLGRATVHTDTSAARQAGYAQGQAAGEADGMRLGRALQAPLSLPADQQRAARAAFQAGYAAGANDVFGGYDGGWDTSAPYVVVLVPGTGGVTYRIDSRTELRDGVTYFLCPGSHTLCQQPRR